MKRDYTVETFNAFCRMIDEINSQAFSRFSELADTIGDAFLRVKHTLGDLGLYDKMKDLDRYYSELMDRENFSREQIEKIFEDESATDSAYGGDEASEFGRIKTQYASFRTAVQSLQDLTQHARTSVSKGRALDWTFSSGAIAAILDGTEDPLVRELVGCEFTSDNFSSYSAEFKSQYVAAFEDENPEYARWMNSVLSDPDLTDAERRDIKFILYTAPEPYRSIYLEHLSDYQIEVRIQNGCWYTSDEQRIYLEDHDETFAKDPRGAYNTFFHESGHLIDDFERDADFLSRNYVFEGRTLHDIMVDDVRSNVTQYIDSKYPGLSAEERTQLLRSLNLTDDASYHYNGSPGSLSPKLRSNYDEIVAHYGSALSGETHECASDIYGGVTNNSLLGTYGYGHRIEQYWYNSNGQSTHKQESELWAEFFAAKMTNDEAALESIQTHFPNAYRAMEAMAQDMLRN